MSEVEYVMKEIACDRDNLDNGLYFSKRNNPVYVERSMPGTYEYDSASEQEPTSDTIDDDTRQLKKTYIKKSKKILFLGIIVIVIILCSIILGIKHALSKNSLAYSCDDFSDRISTNTNARYKYCFVSRIINETFCIGYSNDEPCVDLHDGILFVFGSQPMRFNKDGETYCQNYKIGYLQNLASALGYGNYKVNKKIAGSSCRSVWLNRTGYFESSSTGEYEGDSEELFPNEVEFYH